MGKVFDEADYQRKLDAARNDISFGEELKFIAKGDSTGLSARKAFEDAKQDALRRARKKMLNRIDEEARDRSRSSLIPIEVEEIVTGKHDDLVQVEG